MTFDELTPQQINQLVHIHIMSQALDEPCTDGELTVLMGSYWECTCGWISDFYVGAADRSTEHPLPIPNYSENMTDAWEALVYRHGRRNYAGDTTRTQLQILLEDRVGADWRDILENMNADVLCQVMLQAVDVIDAKGTVLVDLDKGD